MIDENAYGLLVSYFDIENDEYALEAEEFVERVSAFRRCWRSCLEEQAGPMRAIDLGHALYIELAEDELPGEPVALLRDLRKRLSEHEIESVGVLTFGGRWLHSDDESSPACTDQLGSVTVHELSLPSEPFRHALDADAAARATQDDEPVGWGPGLYLESEAIEAMGRKLKNAPTPLEAGGATFFRISA
ncbi:MAG TPA: hypothetical protein VK524_17145 [Polyangiaceae bacterium]|nr:hypothetical protein [Polyangiaceae bacterium]